jgi:hypothetical protein
MQGNKDIHGEQVFWKFHQLLQFSKPCLRSGEAEFLKYAAYPKSKAMGQQIFFGSLRHMFNV